MGLGTSGQIDLSRSVVKSGGEYLYNASGISSQLPAGTGDFAGALLDLATNWNNLSKLSPQQKTALAVHLASTGVALVPVVGWIVSGLIEGEYALATALMGDQSSHCGTDQSKPYGAYDASVFSYNNLIGDFDPAPAGSFLEFAQQMLVQDFNSNNTCWQDGRLRMPVVLSLAVQAWNASHSSAGTPTVENFGLGLQRFAPNSGGTVTLRYSVNNPYGGNPLQQVNPNFGWPQSADPVAVALNIIASVGHTNETMAGPTFVNGLRNTTALDPDPVPPGAYMSFVVNNGGPIALDSAAYPRAGGGWIARGGGGVSTPSSTTSTILVGTAAVAGAALLGTYGYARYKHQSYGSVWRQIWQKTGGHVRMPHILGKGKR